MLHGCRTDLILKCLVNSNKDRTFFSYFSI